MTPTSARIRYRLADHGGTSSCIVQQTDSFVMPVGFTIGACWEEAGQEENIYVWLLNILVIYFLFRTSLPVSQLREDERILVGLELNGTSRIVQTIKYVICHTTHLPCVNTTSIQKEVSCRSPSTEDFQGTSYRWESGARSACNSINEMI